MARVIQVVHVVNFARRVPISALLIPVARMTQLGATSVMDSWHARKVSPTTSTLFVIDRSRVAFHTGSVCKRLLQAHSLALPHAFLVVLANWTRGRVDRVIGPTHGCSKRWSLANCVVHEILVEGPQFLAILNSFAEAF